VVSALSIQTPAFYRSALSHAVDSSAQTIITIASGHVSRLPFGGPGVIHVVRPNCRRKGTTTMNSSTETTATTTTAAVAEQGAPVAPKEATSTRKAGTRQTAPKGRKRAATEAATAPAKAPKAAKGARKAAKGATAKAKATKRAATAKKPARATTVPCEFSKKAIVLDLLERKASATMAEIMEATDWQAHSVRGFVSGMLGKRMGLKVDSTKSDAGERCYKIAGK